MRNQSGKWKVESGDALCIDRSLRATPFPLSYFPFRQGHRRAHSRAALTLIELLIAIAIIATLSAMFLGASRAAMEQSRASRTKTTISKLHTLLMEQWNSYETRRVDTKGVTTNHADDQLLGIRELMKFEMPDRWSNVTGVEQGTTPLPDNDPNLVLVLKNLPTLAKIYRRRYVAVNPSEQYEGAECLYMIIMYACGDGESRTMFSAQDIGDVDGDGAPEFLDGWGRPIHFVRWPAGFVSASPLMSGDAQTDHDPFDPFQRDIEKLAGSTFVSPIGMFNDKFGAFRLVPLIFSSGPDGASGVLTPGDAFVSGFPRSADTYDYARLDPYAEIFGNDVNSNLQQLAAVGGPEGESSDHIDNIHNHLQEAR